MGNLGSIYAGYQAPAGSIYGGGRPFKLSDLGSTLVGFYTSDVGVSLSGSNVTGWADQSGHGNNLTGIVDPTYTTSSNAGLPAIVFNGSQMDCSVGGAHTHRTMFVVLAAIGANASVGVLDSANHSYVTVFNTPNQLQLATAGSPNSGQTITGATPTQLGCVIRANNDVDFYLGRTKTNKTTGTGSFSDAAFTLGADPSGVQNGQFTIQCLIVCDTALSNANVAKVQQWLSTKYGVT